MLDYEDLVSDVLRKAQRGLGLSAEELARRAGCSAEALAACLADAGDAETLERLAFVLNLNAQVLVFRQTGAISPPLITLPSGSAMFTTPFGGDMSVNAYLIWDADSRQAVSFDSGTDAAPILECIRQHDLTLRYSFITHTHWDHLADLERLLNETGAIGYGPGVENPLGLNLVAPGAGFAVGHLRIRVLNTPGHTPGGTSYLVQGLDEPLVIVGDALFAGSVGGAPLAYEQALHYIQKNLLSLPANTVVCPGHGPLTSVATERCCNPFFHLQG